MTLLKLTTFGNPQVFPTQIFSGNSSARRLLHIGVHNSANRNAGDTLLFPVVRKVFDSALGPCNWELRQAWESFSVDDAMQINDQYDGIVIGGGGLLLLDQAGSDTSKSGWQWNSTVSAIQAIAVPLVVFAIGYNRFRGQSEFSPIFTEHIRSLVNKASFFGLRNTGSIRALSSYLLPDQCKLLARQYCPTTILWQLFPQYQKIAISHDVKRERIFVFNAAFDRSEHRFGLNIDKVLDGVAKAVRNAQNRGWKIIVVAHKSIDRQIEPYLDERNVSYCSVDLTEASPDEVMTFYAQVDFVFGMRGHAQMIPFGLRRPIMSIISHDKMRFFLEDIKRCEWGVEIDSSDMEEQLNTALERIEDDRESVHSDIAEAQYRVWLETEQNFSLIESALKGGE